MKSDQRIEPALYLCGTSGVNPNSSVCFTDTLLTFSCLIAKRFLWIAQTTTSPSPKYSSFSQDEDRDLCFPNPQSSVFKIRKDMQRWSLSSGPRPYTTAGLVTVAAATGPHHGKPEEAETASLQEIWAGLFSNSIFKIHQNSQHTARDNGICLGTSAVYSDECLDSASCPFWPRGSLPAGPLSQKS